MLFTALASNAIAAPRDDEAIVSRVPRSAVGSSALATIGYSKRLRALEVEFHNGATYRYLNVPPGIYRALLVAPSKAAYYDANIRGRYRSVRVRRRP
jgi:hypothetical protein